MYQLFPSLIHENDCAQLLNAAQENSPLLTPSYGVMRRMGSEANSPLSDYKALKYWKMPSALQTLIDALLERAKIRAEANEIWLLHVPQGGNIAPYQSVKSFFNCLSVPLNTGGSFEIAHTGKALQAHTNTAGHGYFFNLSQLHQVAPTQQEDWYLCALYLHHIQVQPHV